MKQQMKMKRVSLEILDHVLDELQFQQDIELIYMIDGKMTVFVEEITSRLAAGDILVINANKKHRSGQADGKLLYARFLITYQLFSDVLDSLDFMFWCDSTRGNDERYDELRGILKKILIQYVRANRSTRNFTYITLCYQMMDFLTRQFLVQSSDREDAAEGERYEERIRQINNYILSNYSLPISIKDLSEKLYLSSGYLSRFFRKNYGMSFADYLTKVRLYHAVEDLLYTELPITRIAYDNGFANEAAFYKSFRQVYGDTPSGFRKNSLQKTEEKKNDSYNQEMEQRLLHFAAEDGGVQKKDAPAAAEAVVCVDTDRKLDPIWSRLINIGSAQELLRSEIREHLILLKEALGIESVRFWDIFSDAMFLGVNDRKQGYNFSRLDSILDYLLENGLKPHIELGAKPKRIQRTVQENMLKEQDYFQKKKVADWIPLMEQLMQHLTERYGQAEIETWRMELWWDERIPRNDAEIEAYFAEFETIYKIVKKYSPAMEVGGFGIRLHAPAEEKLLREWLRREIRPDFISQTAYAYDKGEKYGDKFSKRNTDMDALLHKVEYVDKILRENAPEIRHYITEWNLTISERNYINDTVFKGAYIMKCFFDFYGKTEMAGYFSGSDRIAEYYDTGVPLFGGTGILTRDSILKPAGFAFEFLGRLYPYFAGKGENYLVTTDRHHSYGIVCHNMRRLNYPYFYAKEDEIEKEQIWKYFEDRDSMEFQITLDGLSPGTYRYKIYRVNEKTGNVFEIWRELGFIEQLDREDVKYLRRICEPKMSIGSMEVETARALLSFTMEPNEILFLKLRRMT